jgi:para-aminobenzoate synthetase component 2
MTEGRELFGVCLGHQIYWRLKGSEIRRSLSPKHGQKIDLNLTPEWQRLLSLPKNIFVQRYNSLCVPAADLPVVDGVMNFVHEGEVLITRGNKILTYQFHPESEGTTYPHSFFSPLSMDLV